MPSRLPDRFKRSPPVTSPEESGGVVKSLGGAEPAHVSAAEGLRTHLAHIRSLDQLADAMPSPGLDVPAPTLDVVSWLSVSGRHRRVFLLPLFPGRSRHLARMKTEGANRIRDMAKGRPLAMSFK